MKSKHIESIGLADKSPRGDGLRPVVVKFKFPCTFTTFTVDDLKEILRYWIIGEELKYNGPDCKGRWMLFDEIKKVFEKTPSENPPDYLDDNTHPRKTGVL